MAKITKKGLMKMLSVLGEITEDQRNSITCSLIGHSKIVTICFGYVNCARCGDQVGDQLMGGYSQAENCVMVGHNCPTCRANYKKMGWKDKLFTPDPFASEDSSSTGDAPLFDERRCRVCGCTDDNACPGGCCWVEEDLCSTCAEKIQREGDGSQ